MAHKDVGEKELRNRELAARKRLEANKRIIDDNTKHINKLFNVKDVPHQSKTRKKKGTVVQFKTKRGRTGR